MMLTDIVIVVVIAVILGVAVWYIYRSKKKGKKCIGCPGDCCSSCDCCNGQNE